MSTDHPAIKECAQACGARVFERGDIVISCLDGHPDGDDDTEGNYNDSFKNSVTGNENESFCDAQARRTQRTAHPL